MRKMMLGLAALLLTSCGGETYPIAPTAAFEALSGIGTPSGLDPLPGGLSPVSVNFEAVAADNAVQWLFSHDGDDIGRIVAQVTPEGDEASTVSVYYLEGKAPDENWRNGSARNLIENYIQRLVVEAVDSTLESRPMDEAIKMDVLMKVSTASMSSMMKDVSASMDEHIANEKAAEKEMEARAATNPYAATRPSTDLSKFDEDR